MLTILIVNIQQHPFPMAVNQLNQPPRAGHDADPVECRGANVGRPGDFWARWSPKHTEVRSMGDDWMPLNALNSQVGVFNSLYHFYLGLLWKKSFTVKLIN